MIAYERLVTPREHLGVLIEPPPQALHALLWDAAATPHRAPDPLDVPLLDTTLAALRRSLRERLQLAPPVLVTGHQAEFFHAGVFAKSIAADALTAQFGGSIVFLTVDSDVPKSAQLAVPHLADGPGGRAVQRVRIDMPACDLRLPVESQPATPVEEWRRFFERVALMLPDAARSLLPAYVRGWYEGADRAIDFTTALIRAQRSVERELGLRATIGLRVSALAATPEFHAFLAAIALRAREFADCYNAAQRDFRRRHRVRNAARPAPPLLIEDRRVELPFWVYRAGEPRRALFVSAADTMRGRAAPGTDAEIAFFGGDALIGCERQARLARSASLAEALAMEAAGWRIRPRALALSCFARYFLADLFLHGLGGAKYDEMMQHFGRRFFGADPPPAGCVTATLRLPLPTHGVDAAALAAARHALRDLRYNPQRRVMGLPGELLRRREALIAEWRELRDRSYNTPRAGHASLSAARRRNFVELREVNRLLLEAAGAQVAERVEEQRRLERQFGQDRVALHREWFYAFHPRATLEQLRDRIRFAVSASS